MRNLFKKSLTLCLVAILAFSCFAGIVSAENTFAATIAVDNQTITPGTTSVDVVLNITSPQIGINEALIEVSSDIGTINSKATLDEATAAIASIELPEGSTNYGSFYLSAKNDISGETTVLGSIATASITVTFTVDENKAFGSYPINIKVDGVRAASGNEDVITFSYATANVTIPAPHVHEYTYTPNEGDKTHNGTCTCGEDAIYNEACVDGDDEDTLCDKCGGETADAEPVEYDVTPNIYSGASRLVEPWGIKYSVRYSGADIDKIASYGVAMILQGDYLESYATDPAAMVASENAYVFTGEDLVYIGLNEKDGVSPQYYALLTEGIRAQNMGDLIYVCPYAIMKDGSYVYGAIKSNSMKKILNNNLNKDTVSAEEKAVCTDMLKLYEDAVAHFDGVDIESLTANDVVAARGSSCEAAASWTQITDTDTRVANISGGASRLVEPWGILYTSKFYDSRTTGTIVDRGVVILNELDYQTAYATDPDAMRLNANSYVFTLNANTLKFSANNADGSASYYALLTEDIYVYNIPTLLYVVSYVVLDDGSYIYGQVKSNSMDKIITNNSVKDSVPATEKAVGADMQALYASVCAYYDVVGWPDFIRR